MLSKNKEWTKWIKLIRLAHPKEPEHPNKTPNKTSDECKHCGNNCIQNDDSQGHQVCGECGAVNGDVIDDRIEWKNKSDCHAFSGNNVRCNAVDDLLPKLSLSTKIVPQYGSKQSYQEHRIARLNQWQSGDPLERALRTDFYYIDGFLYSKQCGFPKNVLHTTKMLFKEYYIASYHDAKQFGSKRNCLRGQTRKGMIGVCIYFACKINKLSCTKEFIATLLGIDKSKIRKARPIFLAMMKDKIVNIEGWNHQISRISTPQDFIRTYQLILGVPHYVSNYSIKFYKYLKEFRVLGSKQPQSIAAVCVFIILSQLKTHATLGDIVNKCKVSKATVKNLYKKINHLKNEGLIYVFTDYVCKNLNIDNVITIDKITHIGRVLSKIQYSNHINNSVKVIIGVSVLFVLIVKNIHPTITMNDVTNVCNVTEKEIIDLAKEMACYKKALIKRFI